MTTKKAAPAPLPGFDSPVCLMPACSETATVWLRWDEPAGLPYQPFCRAHADSARAHSQHWEERP